MCSRKSSLKRGKLKYTCYFQKSSILFSRNMKSSWLDWKKKQELPPISFPQWRMYFSFLFHISDIIMKLILISYHSANTLTFLWFFSCLTFAQEPVYQCSKALQFTYTCISITVTCTCTTAFSPIQKLLWTKCKPDWCLKKIGVKM